MVHRTALTIFGLVLIYISSVRGNSCFRIPENQTPITDNTYTIEISGNPQGYTANENYTVTITTNPGATDSRFTEFTLVAEPVNAADSDAAGKFVLLDRLETTFNPHCVQTVTHLSTMAKKQVRVLWRAPPSGSGCVMIKALVYKNINNWYSGGGLSRVLCEDDEESEDRLPKILEICNACSEARYEVAFQGLWSRNTHPKGFPENVHETKLGDVIGASHKYNKSFWSQSGVATPGLKLLAEEGNTSLLETELKQMSDDIRTIIKARELAHPKLTGTTYTICRVDSENHLVSLVSKITPSPDWIVGVANLDLCLENGSWVSSYTLNLYPWDVGTDDGLSYESADAPSQYLQFIRPIKSNSPNTEESPFFDPDGEPIKPLAKLHLTRQKRFDKECNSARIGSKEANNCEFGEWNEWSSCSVTCGKGVRTRDRPILNSESCTEAESGDLQETEECEADEACQDEVTPESDCPNTVWEPWGPCSVTCGSGVRERFRSNILEDEDANEENDEEEQNDACQKISETVECHNPLCVFGDVKAEEQIRPGRDNGPLVNCVVTKWSVWSPCNKSLPCKERYKYKVRYVLTPARNGGRACPIKLRKKRKCNCGNNQVLKIVNSRKIRDEVQVDCKLGSWSKWSPCNTSCGDATQQRTRDILVPPTKYGKPCGSRVQHRKCSSSFSCSGLISQYNNY